MLHIMNFWKMHYVDALLMFYLTEEYFCDFKIEDMT